MLPMLRWPFAPFPILRPFRSRRRLAIPRAASVQARELGVQSVAPDGTLTLRDGTRRVLLRVAADPFSATDAANAEVTLRQLAAAFNGLRSTLTILVWGEPTGVQAQRAALQSRLSSPALTDGRRALAESHLALLDTLQARQTTQRSSQPAPRQYTYLLTLDAPASAAGDAAALERDARELCQAFGATRLDASAALSVLAQGWRALSPVTRVLPGGRSVQGWTGLQARLPDGQVAGGVGLRVTPSGTRLVAVR